MLRLFASLLLSAVCWANLSVESVAGTSCGEPVVSDGEWRTSSLAEAGFDTATICSIDQVLDKSPNVHAIVIVRHGKLVYENYRTALGTLSHTPQTLHEVRSISKSVVSLLFGIAIDRKLIPSLDEPALKFFPSLASHRSPDKERINLQHLLTMTPGLAWDERRSAGANSEVMMSIAADPYRFVFEQPIVHVPGAQWEYSGGTTQVLAGVLQKASDKSLVDFAREALFEPLGINKFGWVRMVNGEIAAASGLRLRPRDMAKIGELVLRGGMWGGHRVVSEAWIKESTGLHVAHIDPAIPSRGYGYQWWVNEAKVSGRTTPLIAAQGRGGQRIYIAPAYDLVVVVTAGLYSNSQIRIPYDLVQKYVLAAIRE